MTATVNSLLAVTIASPQPEALSELLTAGLGWEVLADGAVGATHERQWGIKPRSAGSHWRVLRAPGSGRGMIRLVHGVERSRSRRFAARWAGVEMVVSDDIDGLWESLQRFAAFDPWKSPLTMDWSQFGSNLHRACVGRTPGQTHLALTMGITKPVDREFPQATARVGHVFELPLITSEFARSRDFYGSVLGMTAILSSSFDRGPWHGLWQLREPTPVQLDILKGDAPGTGLGGIELTGYESDLIDPEPAQRDQFDGGTCMVTYDTTDIEAAFRAVAGDRRAQLLSEPHAVDDALYRGSRSFAFLGPDGERVELVSRTWS
jgi:catechol 2,3-dioxygenase-like lactoylglutathione lyase family enzyme